MAKSEIKQGELAKAMGVSQATVSCVCNGKRGITQKFLEDAASVFGVKVSELIAWGE